MKKLITVFTMLFMFTMVSPYVEAKKFGGGKSFGKQHSTTAAKKQGTHQQSNTSNTNNKQNQTSDTPKSKGFMGGMLGGLLAGGLLGSMLGGGLGGLGGGGGFMGILLLALLAFAVFKVIKLMKGMNIKPTTSNEEYATNTYQQPIDEQPTNEQFREQHNAIDHSATNEQNTVSTETLINLPPNFNTKSCITEACSHYKTIQQAWDANDFSKIKEYVAPALVEELKTERSHLSQTQQTTVLYIDAEIVRADYNEDLAQLSIKFFGKYKEDDNIEKEIDDIWHLERNLKASNSPWLILGIE